VVVVVAGWSDGERAGAVGNFSGDDQASRRENRF
jgi:hypothetical protein